MKRVCLSCNQERDAEQDFSWKYKARGIRQTRCKFCIAETNKQHYNSNKEKHVARVRSREIHVIEENQKRLAEYLRKHPCVDCGKTDIRVLEFDHVRGHKLHNIARMIGDGFSWSTIEAEIAKCEVRCANCHRIKTNERSGFWRHCFISPAKEAE